jgi:hypothetical protein
MADQHVVDCSYNIGDRAFCVVSTGKGGLKARRIPDSAPAPIGGMR